MKNLLLIGLCSCVALLCRAQSYHFDHLNVEDGLSQNTVNCILKDSRGYLWIGTNDGLNRYDGYSFTTYQHRAQDSTSLSNNKVYALLEDREGNLWIGTKNGLNRYNRQLDHFQQFLHTSADSTTLSGNFIRSLYEDQKGTLWIGTLGNGLNRWLPEKQKFQKVALTPPSTESTHWQNVSTMLEDRYGNFWVGTGAHGLIHYDRQSRQTTFLPFDTAFAKTRSGTGKTFFEDRKGNLWIGTQGEGVYFFDAAQRTFQHFDTQNSGLNRNIVNAILEDESGRIWIGTDGGGINIFDPEQKTFTHLQHQLSDANSLASNSVYTFFKDEEGVTWIGTFDGGISILNDNRKNFQHYTVYHIPGKGLSHHSVLSFLEDRNGRIWIGTDGGGLNQFHPDEQRFSYLQHQKNEPHSLSSNVVTALYEDRAGGLWVGTYTGGLQQFKPGKGFLQTYQHDETNPHSLRNNNVWAILEDSRQNFWIGTLGGLEKLDRQTGTFEHIYTKDSEGNTYFERVTTLYEDQAGLLWVGGKGVRTYNANTGQLDPLSGKAGDWLRSYDVRAFFEDSQQRFWIGTEGGGLFLYDRQAHAIRSFTMTDGLPSNAIHSILEDEQGNLWLSTNHGLTQFDPDRLLQVSSAALAIFKNYTKDDGLQSNQFSYGAAMQTSRGQFYFGGVNGFNVFNPATIKDNPHVPPVEITGLKIYDQYARVGAENSPLPAQISELDEITLTYKQSLVFSLEFTALNFTSSEKNQYAYRLEGFMEDWNYLGAQRNVTFTNLNHGTYIFRVKASNNDGIWNETGTSLKLTILPPFWKTNWAYALYVLLFLLILLAFRHTLLMRERMKNELIIKDIERQKVEEVNRMKLSFFTNISHEFRTPLTLIIAPVEQLLQSTSLSGEANHQLRIVQRNARRLLQLINQLLDFRKIEDQKMELQLERQDLVVFVQNIKTAFDNFAETHRIRYDFHSNVEQLPACFDPDKLEKIIYNLLSNAFKFTPDEGTIIVSLQRHVSGKKVQLAVSDNGIGISKERQAHIFDRFYQISPDGQLKNKLLQTGSGIGLAYTKELVELHQGELRLTSEKGKGSTFTVCLPLTLSVQKHSTQAPPDRQLFDFLIENPVDATDDFVSQSAVAKTGERPLLLIVEDDREVREFIRFSFQKDFEVLAANDGEAGFKEATTRLPDIIISDIKMPRKDGIQLCRELKADDRTSHIPVLLLTANTSQERYLNGLETGADDYITKPFHFPILAARIHNLIESRRKLKERFSRDILQPGAVEIQSSDAIFLKKAIHIIEENMSDSDFCVSRFAKKLGMSRSVLYRKFSALTDQSVKEFINTIRLKRAAQLLEAAPDMTVAEVAYSVGFSDAQYFSKKFKKYFRCTPTQYSENPKRYSISGLK